MPDYEVELRANAFTAVVVEAESAEDAQEKALVMARRHEIESDIDCDDWEVDGVDEV